MNPMKQTKRKTVKRSINAWAKIPDCSCLGEPLQVYSSKKEAQDAIAEMECRLYGINALYTAFKPGFDSVVIPVTITYTPKRTSKK